MLDNSLLPGNLGVIEPLDPFKECLWLEMWKSLNG